MNKKVQKGLVAAVAATMGASVVAPVVQAATQTLAQQYEAAYKAYEKAAASKDQKDLTAARGLLEGLYKTVKGTKEEYLATTLSSILDPVQQEKFEFIISVAKTEAAKVEQKNINSAKYNFNNLSDSWKVAFNSYSSAIDTVQQAYAVHILDMVKAAKTVAELDAAKAKFADLMTIDFSAEAKASYEAAIKPEIAKVEAVVSVAKIDSVTATGVRKLEVKFNKAVDTTKAVFEIKKGNTKVNTESITFNADKTVATINFSGKLTEGEYAVNVSGLGEAALTGKVTTTNETVKGIQILSEEAALSSTKASVTVGYKVVNQYGEDITNTTSLTATAGGAVVSSSAATATKGKITISVDATKVREGDTISIALVHGESGVTGTRILKVSSQASISELNITGLYNKDSKVLNENTDFSKDPFFLVVDAKDQYGNKLTETDLATALVFNQTNNTVVNVNSTVETITINGEDATVLRLAGPLKPGENTVMLVSKATGKTASYKVVVAEGQRTDVATIQVPDLVVANETTFIPVEVLDKDGNIITNLDVLNHATKGVKITGYAGITIKKNAEGKVGFDIAPTADGILPLVAITSSNKVSTTNINVREEAAPVRVDGVKSSVKTTLINAGTTTLDSSTIKFIDQYERVMTTSQAGAKIDNSSTGTKDYYIKLVETTGNNAVTITGNTVAAHATELGTEKVEIQLWDRTDAKLVSGSEKTVTFRVTDGNEYVGYEVEDLTKMYDEVGNSKANDAKYDQAITVYGVLNDGRKVELDPSAYSVNASSFLDYSAGVLALDTTAGAVPYAEDADDYATSVTVTINATGDVFKKEFVVSKVAPTVAQLKVIADTTDDADFTVTDFNNLDEINTLIISGTTIDKTNFDYAIIDSYGVAHYSNDGTFSHLTALKLLAKPVTGTVTIVSNNTNSLSVSGIDSNEVVNITITVGSITKTIRAEK